MLGTVKYISRPETARRWGKSIDTLRRMERAGTLVPYRFGANSVSYLISEVEAVEEQARAPRAQRQPVDA